MRCLLGLGRLLYLVLGAEEAVCETGNMAADEGDLWALFVLV